MARRPPRGVAEWRRRGTGDVSGQRPGVKGSGGMRGGQKAIKQSGAAELARAGAGVERVRPFRLAVMEWGCTLRGAESKAEGIGIFDLGKKGEQFPW